ncbi:MAG: helix-turn-helix domain-containing protein [Mesorhizobium sp.]
MSKNRAWTWRHAITQSGLAPTTRLVLLTISCFMNDTGDGCYPTTKQLAEATGLSERAVCTHIDVAKQAGWLTVSVHGFKGQKWKNHQYKAAWPEGEGTEPDDKKALKEVQHVGTDGGSAAYEKALNVLPKGTEPDDKKALKEVQSTSPVTNPITNSMSERGSDPCPPSKKKQDYPEAFEAFWQGYPRTPNMSKPKALAGWKKLTEAERVACHQAVPAYRSFLASKRDHPTMHASTFINERRFEGFVEQAAASAPRTVTTEDWTKRLAFARQNGKWHVAAWGPMPGQTECHVPANLLQPSDGQSWAEWEA